VKRIKSGSEFNKVMLSYSKETEKMATLALQKMSNDAFRSLVMRTAREYGFARSNWEVSVNTPLEGLKKHPGPGSYSDAAYPSISIVAGDVIILYNNTEYIIHLEMGTARQRAQPMVEPTYRELLSVAKAVSDRLSRTRMR